MTELLIGVLVTMVTVVMHGLFTTTIAAMLERYEVPLLRDAGHMRRSFIVAASACGLLVKHTVDILIWAVAFWVFAGSELPNFESSVYFSSVTYTTLGYGDIVIAKPARMLCGFEAMNGLILFGLSTASLFVLVDRLWIGRRQ